ncbi:DUF1214 domain-containing protein [Paraburkholderia acidiphila]|uniref:DUF1214 domain-containing protein n=2 Tax=Paraburkholderia acidiphila TaxID=2571747 RepID=A0A7Z2G6D6_9BURK|nr:DUF1214 domain-containing protein [Paraburkholderia acidiphila]
MKKSHIATLVAGLLTASAVSLASVTTSAGAPVALNAASGTPGRLAALPPAPDSNARITEAYARMVARQAYFWGWPLVNIYNRRLAFEQAPAPGLIGGILPFAPLNRLAMLHDYVEPQERDVACPNQDVVYGGSVVALDISPVVVQVPDFGKRFWVYQIVDARTDSFASLGMMYGTKPGFYLLVGPNWNGKVPAGINGVYRSTTSTGMVVPRVFQDDTAADKQAVKAVIQGINIYPLSEFDGKMKRRDWATLPVFPKPASSGGTGETAWVFPDKFFDQLPPVMADAPAMPGEAGLYAQIRAVLEAAKHDPALKKIMTDEATRAQKELVDPLLQFRHWGNSLPYHWSTISNGAVFGTDYFTRTAVAKSNILVNANRETKYFYQDLSADGARLNGAHRYTVTFLKGQTPPVDGFWSLTLYSAEHFFVPNEIKRYSIGTKNRDLQYNADGSLTIYIQADAPKDAKARANWLPAPANADFSLYLRAYGPKHAIVEGQWTPPGVNLAAH